MRIRMREELGDGSRGGYRLLRCHERPHDRPRIKFAGSQGRDQRLDVLAAGDRDKKLAPVRGEVRSAHREPLKSLL